MSASQAIGFERSVIARVRNHCVPVLMLAFIVSYVDRINVGFAAITANKDLGLTATMYGWGAGLLFVGYSVFELPSNLALERFGARRWMARIMITWGFVSALMVFVNGPWSFYAVRFLLGAAEAGFFPGAVLFLTYWFPKRYRARYVAQFALGIPLASVIGSPISGMLLGLNGWLGLKGWQWLYVMEALPAVLLGIWILMFLADGPQKARWLSQPEKDWLTAELDRERAAHSERRHIPPLRMLGDGRTLMLALIFFLTGVPSYGVSLWLPQIVKSFGLTNTQTGFVSAFPFLFGCVATVWWANRSDRARERAWHTAAAAALAGVALIGGGLTASPLLQMAALCISCAGIYGLKGPWLAMISESYSARTAAAGIALVSTLGSLSGFAAPYMVGVIIDATGDHRLGLISLGVQSVLGALLVVLWSRGAGRRSREAALASPVPDPA